jgi:hypothetical protein
VCVRLKAKRLLALLGLAAIRICHAEEADQKLEQITVVATGASNMRAASTGDIDREQLLSLPLLRPAALLENIPGLIVTQHSGEGKANQYFLRAFNLDHGTDLALDVDDMPVNMPTHAHGQGYSDLNFLIPETAGELHYKKGPYYADEGDFATAGTARIGLVSDLPDSATLGLGQDGYRRALVMGSAAMASGTLLGAGEFYHNDGPFDVPDDYRRLNGLLRYTRGDDRDFFTVTAMAYSGRWNSTDQVAEREAGAANSPAARTMADRAYHARLCCDARRPRISSWTNTLSQVSSFKSSKLMGPCSLVNANAFPRST